MSKWRLKVKLTSTLLLILMCLYVNAQGLNKKDIQLNLGHSSRPGCVVVNSVTNLSDVDVTAIFINEYSNERVSKHLKSYEQREVGLVCNVVRAKPSSMGNERLIDIYRNPRQSEKVENVKKTEEKDELPGIQEKSVAPKVEVSMTAPSGGRPLKIYSKKVFYMSEVIADFNSYIETIPYYSVSAIREERAQVENHANNLRNWKDRNGYIAEHRLNSFLTLTRDSLRLYSEQTSKLIEAYLDRFGNGKIINREACIDSMKLVVTKRLQLRGNNIDCLAKEMSLEDSSFDTEVYDWKVIGACVGVVAILLILVVLLARSGKNKRKKTWVERAPDTSSNPSSTIIVRRKTTSILRKQSLEDVIGNGAYFQIDCKEFCEDSAVRKIYIKNACIKDMYNMYAEDLRNPNNPKEDGCMVLGRWVRDGETDEYYVSLEHIVKPGDDAMLGEYELNFGGKIKLKVTEKLRRLRRETNLQYDLTCWVHSHPGLGVFFSNSDNNVQSQLKSPSHPNFLTAIVVDILTPNQEMGIFTFKHDATMNSKADLKKLYSLEELYQWAVESDRSSFKPEDYYNTLSKAISIADNCSGIGLSNGAIIDMGLLVAEQMMGFVGKVYGYVVNSGLEKVFVVTSVVKPTNIPDNDFIGSFVIATHCSIPSIRKAIAAEIGKVKFVLVYTTTDGLLTTIPVLNGDLCVDEKYYGEQKLEDLKVWTRRKR